MPFQNKKNIVQKIPALLLLLLSIACTGQRHKPLVTPDLSRESLRGNVHTVLVEHFTTEDFDDADAEERVSAFEKLEFDKEGNITSSEVWIDSNLYITSEHAQKMEFDNGILTHISAEGYQYEIENTPLMNATNVYEKRENTDTLYSTYRFIYNDTGQLVQQMRYDHKMRLMYFKRWHYYPDGQVKSSFEDNYAELFLVTARTDYDENGKITKRYDTVDKYYEAYSPLQGDTLWNVEYYNLMTNQRITHLPDEDSVAIRVEQLFRFDENGNWIYRERRNYNKNWHKISKRQIMYYDNP